jgi:hypothetical protein
LLLGELVRLDVDLLLVPRWPFLLVFGRGLLSQAPLFIALAGGRRVGEGLRHELPAEGGQGVIVVFTEGLGVAAESVELAAEPIGGTWHPQIPDADRDSVRPVPA